MKMNRKLVPPLTRKMIMKLAELFVPDVVRPAGINIFEFNIGQLYKRGILQIKKRVENGVFILFISVTESGEELLKIVESSLEPEYHGAAEMAM